MPRLIWLADELRRAGLRVVEVDGWKTRGSAEFTPEGMTWHATAGSRTSTAQGEVNVILHGSTSAPPPIAQMMLYRDGTIYVCAAGRCNHNKVGWDGPNEGLGNSRLIGLEMANDNRGEPWPAVQLDAARRATAAIFKRLRADPMRRLAAHYEHQPYATRPAGEGSTKSDPHGIDMTKERPRVAALMKEDDMPSAAEIAAELRPVIRAEITAQLDDIGRAVWTADVIPVGSTTWAAGGTVGAIHDQLPARVRAALAADLNGVTTALQALAARNDVDEQALADALAPAVAGLVLAGLPAGTDQVSQEEVTTAVAEAFRDAFTPRES